MSQSLMGPGPVQAGSACFACAMLYFGCNQTCRGRTQNMTSKAVSRIGNGLSSPLRHLEHTRDESNPTRVRPHTRFIGGWRCVFGVIAATTVMTTSSSEASNDGSVECGVDEFADSSCSFDDPPYSSIPEQRQRHSSLLKEQTNEKWN